MTRYIKNTHPGEFLAELIEDMNLTKYKVAKATSISQIAIGEIVRGKRGVSHENGLLLDKFFGFSEGYFSRLQDHYDTMEAKRKMVSRLARIKPYGGRNHQPEMRP